MGESREHLLHRMNQQVGQDGRDTPSQEGLVWKKVEAVEARAGRGEERLDLKASGTFRICELGSLV